MRFILDSTKTKLHNTNGIANYSKHSLGKDVRVNTKLSLIIPVLQEEKILDKHLKALIEYKKKYNFEIIVSDGGSTDNTVEIARKYADRVVVHEESRRQTIAEGRNRGAELADADVLVFLNGDSIPVDFDVFFTTIIQFASQEGKYAKYGALACEVGSFPEEELLKDKIFYKIHNNYVAFLNFIGLGMGRGECQIVRKDIFEKAGKYNDKIVAGEDFDLYRRIAKVAKIKYDKNIAVHESPRRFRKYGYIRTIVFWLVNSLSVWWFGKSYSDEWEAIR